MIVLQNSVTGFREFEGQNTGFCNENMHDFLVAVAEECDSLVKSEVQLLEQAVKDIQGAIELFQDEISLLAEAKYGNECCLVEKKEYESEEGSEILKSAFFELNSCISNWNSWIHNVNRMFLLASQASFAKQQQWKQEKTNLHNIGVHFNQLSEQLTELIRCFSPEKDGNHSSSREREELSLNFDSIFAEPALELMHLIQETFPSSLNSIPKASCITNLNFCNFPPNKQP